MTSTTKPQMDVVKREDKEAKLRAFIAQFLASPVTSANGKTWLLVARSPESPVVLALAHFAAELDASGIRICAILTDLMPTATETVEASPINFASELRIARNPRLLDAHEQLYLGTSTSWVGDCMRREPAKRDAYECYARDCQITARWTQLAFERIWLLSELVALQPMQIGIEPQADPEASLAAAFARSAPDAETQATVSGSTRH